MVFSDQLAGEQINCSSIPYDVDYHIFLIAKIFLVDENYFSIIPHVYALIIVAFLSWVFFALFSKHLEIIAFIPHGLRTQHDTDLREIGLFL